MTDKPFNPADFLEDIGGKNYLNPRNALTWFYNDHPAPEGRVITVLLSSEPVIFRAEVYIGDVQIATGHANADNNSKTMRKIESSAVRRALANAGYGTEQATQRLVKRIASQTTTEQKKEKLGSGVGQERRMGKTDKPDGGDSLPWATEKQVTGLIEHATNRLGLTWLDISRYTGVKTQDDYPAWNEKYASRTAAGEAIKAGHEAEMAALKPAEPKEAAAQPV